jgi:hypothetical protein
VYVTDSRTNETSPATYGAPGPNGASTWTWTLDLPQNSPEGSYHLSYAAKDCASDTVLTLTPWPSISYVIDNTP